AGGECPQAGAGDQTRPRNRGAIFSGGKGVSAASQSLPPSSIDVCRSKRVAASIANSMTVDVEDYFQVEAFASTIERKDCDHLPRRVEANTLRLLDIFAEAKVQATFFMLGWVAQRH